MRISRLVAPAVALLAALVAPLTAHAHFIWGTIENGQVRFALLEDPNEKPDVRFEKYVTGLKSSLALDAPKDGACRATLTASAKSAQAETTVGVRERGGPPYLLHYRARAAASLESAGQATKGAATDVTVKKDSETLVVTVWEGGWPCPASEVTVHTPDGGQLTATTDLAGTATIPWPRPARSGFLGVRARVVEAVPGEVDGKKYAEVHHWTTLSFPVSVPLTTSQALRKELQGNHEVIGRAAFNRTLFSGAMTRRQAELHLQHRAQILSEVDRILRGAPGFESVYGEQQRACVAYLQSDLKAHGLSLPGPDDTPEPIRALLGELRVGDAYFALGVWHVFYGGTVNGGRLIGPKLAEKLGGELTHYTKSDGYGEYLSAIDRLAPDTALPGMSRGAQSAYKHLIASMNESVFESSAEHLAGK